MQNEHSIENNEPFTISIIGGENFDIFFILIIFMKKQGEIMFKKQFFILLLTICLTINAYSGTIMETCLNCTVGNQIPRVGSMHPKEILLFFAIIFFITFCLMLSKKVENKEGIKEKRRMLVLSFLIHFVMTGMYFTYELRQDYFIDMNAKHLNGTFVLGTEKIKVEYRNGEVFNELGNKLIVSKEDGNTNYFYDKDFKHSFYLYDEQIYLLKIRPNEEEYPKIDMYILKKEI